MEMSTTQNSLKKIPLNLDQPPPLIKLEKHAHDQFYTLQANHQQANVLIFLPTTAVMVHCIFIKNQLFKVFFWSQKRILCVRF